jgi:methionine-rich copper-binding protein CopC
LSKDGNTQIQFYTGYVTGDFVVKFQGITEDGRLVSGSHYFTVDNSL